MSMTKIRIDPFRTIAIVFVHFQTKSAQLGKRAEGQNHQTLSRDLEPSRQVVQAD